MLSLLNGEITYMFDVKHEFLWTSHKSVTINLSPLGQEEGACQLLIGSLEFFCTHERKARRTAGQEGWREAFREEKGWWWKWEGHGERWRQTCCSVLAALQRRRCALWTNKNTGQLNITFPSGAWVLGRCDGLQRAEEGMYADLLGSPPEGEGGMDHTRVRSALSLINSSSLGHK